MTDTTVRVGPELTITDLNGALHSYCVGHQENFPGTAFNKAAVAFMAQCPVTARCYARREIKPEEQQTVAGEALNALAKMYQLKHKSNFLDALRAICAEHPQLKAWYTGTEEDTAGQTYAASGGVHGATLADQQATQAQAGKLLDSIAQTIRREQPHLGYEEAFKRAQSQHPNLASAYHGNTSRTLA